MEGGAMNKTILPLASLELSKIFRSQSSVGKTMVALGSALAMVYLAVVQPSAYGLEYAAATHISLPAPSDTANLTGSSEDPATVDGHLQAQVTLSANELALVSIASKNVEMARTIGGAQLVAKEIIASDYGWSNHEFGCLKSLWGHESHWNYKARNKRSGAHGIAQALPAIKMEVIGSDWRTNPVTQIKWGLRYIDIRYSTPCKALAKFKRSRYY